MPFTVSIDQPFNFVICSCKRWSEAITTLDCTGNLPQKTTTTVLLHVGRSVIASHCFFEKKFEEVKAHFSGTFLRTKETFLHAE